MAGAGGYGALFLPPPVCPEKNLVAQNYAANTLHAHARELAGCFQNGNTIHAHTRELALVTDFSVAKSLRNTIYAHTRELAHDALKRCVSLSHPTRVPVKNSTLKRD